MDQVNPQIKDAVKTTNQSVTSASVSKNFGSAVAYQSVAHTSSIVVQDAGDMVRNVSTICTAAIAVFVIRIVEEDNPMYVPYIQLMQETIQQAGETFVKIGGDAAQVLKNFAPE